MAKAFDLDTAGTLQTGLLSWYNFESSSVDEFGSNNGSDTGSPTYTAGKVGNALTLNGSTQYTNTTNALTGLGAVSVSAWIKTTASLTYQAIVVQTDNINKNFQFRINSTGKLEMVLTTAADTTLAGTTVFSTGTYYHVIFVYDGANMYLYVNGSQENSTTKTGTVNSNNSNLTIGAYATGGIQTPFNGQIDMVGVWSKALGAQEISDLYNGGAGNAYRTQAGVLVSRFILNQAVNRASTY